MNTFKCNNPTEVHFGGWITPKQIENEPEDIVQKFKSNPDSFFSPMTPPARKLLVK